MEGRSREETISWIVEKIINDIEKGSYDHNPKLTSEHALAAELEVSRFLVRQAFERLQGLGYVYSKQGVGHFVVQRKISIEFPLNSNKGFSSKVKAQGFDVKSQLLLLEKIAANSNIAAQLEISENEFVYKIKRARLVERNIVAIHTSYLAQAKFPHLERYGSIDSLFEILQKYQIDSLESRESLLEVTLPTEEEVKIFRCPKLISLINLKGINYDAKTGKPVEYYEVKYRGDIFKYKIIGG